MSKHDLFLSNFPCGLWNIVSQPTVETQLWWWEEHEKSFCQKATICRQLRSEGRVHARLDSDAVCAVLGAFYNFFCEPGNKLGPPPIRQYNRPSETLMKGIWKLDVKLFMVSPSKLLLLTVSDPEGHNIDFLCKFLLGKKIAHVWEEEELLTSQYFLKSNSSYRLITFWCNSNSPKEPLF